MPCRSASWPIGNSHRDRRTLGRQLLATKHSIHARSSVSEGAATEPIRTDHLFIPSAAKAAYYIDIGSDASVSASPRFVVQLLFDQSLAVVILKMGSRVAYPPAHEFEEQLRVIAVEVVDTTAAGVALNSAFAVGLMPGKIPYESWRSALAVLVTITRACALQASEISPQATVSKKYNFPS